MVFGLTMPLITITVPHDALPDLDMLPAAYVKDDVTKKPTFDAVPSVLVEHAVSNNKFTLTNFQVELYTQDGYQAILKTKRPNNQ
jgi:hypothetical protein